MHTNYHIQEGSKLLSSLHQVPPLSVLARHALLHGLSRGIPVTFREEITNPIILSDDAFWHDLMNEARDRRLLCDTFLSALSESGMPPRKLELKGGRGDAAVTERWLFHGNSLGNTQSEQKNTFSSVSEMLLSSIGYLKLSDVRKHSSRSIRRVEDELFDKKNGYLSSHSDNDSLRRFVGKMGDLSTALHSVARTCNNLEHLEVGPFGRNRITESDYSLTGALKAVTASCQQLRHIFFHGLVLRADQTGSNSFGSLSFFESFSQNCGTTLERLSLSQCSGIQDRHIQALLLHNSGCPMLQMLDLSFTEVGSLSFSALSQRCADHGHMPLSSLILDGTMIDVKWLRNIVQSSLGRQLEELSLLACPALEKGVDVWDTLTVPKGVLPNMKNLSIELWLSSNNLLEAKVEEGSYEMTRDNSLQVSKHIELGNGDGWACCHCTLINEDFLLRCLACNGRRYTEEDVLIKDMASASLEAIHTFNEINSPLHKFMVLAHIDEEGNRLSLMAELEARNYGSRGYSDISSRNVGNVQQCTTAEACTKFAGVIFQSLPLSIRDLSIVFPGENRSFLLNINHVKMLLDTYGPFLEHLCFDSVMIQDSNVSNKFLSLLKALKSLRLHADRELGVSSTEVLRSISARNSMIEFSNLELLHIAIHDSGAFVDLGDVVGAFISSNGEQRIESEVLFNCGALKYLLVHGCASIQRLDLLTPNLKRLHISHCPALISISFSEANNTFDSNKLERLRLCRNLSLDPHSLSMMQLPRLKMIHLDGISALQDWQLGDLINSSKCLSCMRLHQCRSLENPTEWRSLGTSCPLNVLHLFRPSPCFERTIFSSLFTDECSKHLRDLRIESASGLTGVLDGESKLDAAPFYESSASSRLGQGALDDDSNLTELLGIRGIQRDLTEFMRNSRPGDEKGFPPTLNSYQRKLVHETAEVMGLEHQSIRLNTGNKVVRVKKRAVLGVIDDEQIVERGQAGMWATDRQHRHYDVNFDAENDNEPIEGALIDDFEGLVERMFDLNTTNVSQASDGQLNDHFIECVLREFIAGDDDVMNVWYGFPLRLSSYELKLIHEVAEDLNLEHESVRLSNGSKAVRLRRRLDRSYSFSDGDDFPIDRYEQPLSRKAARKANKLKKKGKAKRKDDVRINDENDEQDDQYSGTFAFDPLLQCELHGRVDSKTQRQLNSLAHQLPRNVTTGKPVCVRYLRGICPFQDDDEICQWAHFNVNESTLKKFGPLFDVVCGRWGRKKSFDAYNLNSSTEKVKRHGKGRQNSSVGSEYDLQSDDERKNSSRSSSKSKRKARRKSSVGNDYDSGYTDDDGISLGTSPKNFTNPFDLSKSPHEQNTNPFTKFSFESVMPTPLNMHYIMNLDLLECDGISGISCEAPFLVRCCLRGCSQLKFLNISNAQSLRILDASDCICLSDIPLHDRSFRNLCVANFISCKSLDAHFMSLLVNHCRYLRSLLIFGSGASEKASNAKTRQKVKTKTGLAKLNSGRPNLEVITTKKEWRESISKQSSFIGGEDVVGLHEDGC